MKALSLYCLMSSMTSSLCQYVGKMEHSVMRTHTQKIPTDDDLLKQIVVSRNPCMQTQMLNAHLCLNHTCRRQLMQRSWKKSSTHNIMWQIITVHGGNSSALGQIFMLFSPFTCMKQERLHRGTVFLWWHGGALKALLWFRRVEFC